MRSKILGRSAEESREVRGRRKGVGRPSENLNYLLCDAEGVTAGSELKRAIEGGKVEERGPAKGIKPKARRI